MPETPVSNPIPPEAASGIVSLLSPERRLALIEEALGAEIRALVATAQSRTIGDLVDALVGHPHWHHLQSLAVATALAPAPAKVARPRAQAPRAAEEVVPPGSPKPKPAAEKKSNGMVDALLAFIALHPGLRGDEIQTHFGGDRLLVRAALEALRAQRKVRTIGSGRAMKYMLFG